MGADERLVEVERAFVERVLATGLPRTRFQEVLLAVGTVIVVGSWALVLGRCLLAAGWLRVGG